MRVLSLLSFAILASALAGCSPDVNNAPDPEGVGPNHQPEPAAVAKVEAPSRGESNGQPVPFKAQVPDAREKARLLAMAESLPTKDGSTVGRVLREAERLRAKQFKLVHGLDLTYHSDGTLAGVATCYWIGDSRKDGDQYCDIGYDLSKDGQSLERSYDGREMLEGSTQSALEEGLQSFLRHIDVRYQTREGEELIEDGTEIQAVLNSIPTVSRSTGRLTLAERLSSLGVRVVSISSGRVSYDEVRLSKGFFKAGDVSYTFTTLEPVGVVAEQCPVWSQFELLKRGRSWLPESRTANFYLFNVCQAPN